MVSIQLNQCNCGFVCFQQSKLTSPTGGASAAVNNPFLSSPTSSGNIVDLFGPTAASAQPPNAKASDDLLQLGNPFADMFGAAPAPAQPLVGNIIAIRIRFACNLKKNIIKLIRLSCSTSTADQCIRVRQQFLIGIWCY